MPHARTIPGDAGDATTHSRTGEVHCSDLLLRRVGRSAADDKGGGLRGTMTLGTRSVRVAVKDQGRPADATRQLAGIPDLGAVKKVGFCLTGL